MAVMVIVLSFGLALAGTVMVYAAYPYRGKSTPVSPRLGEAMTRGVERLPILNVDDEVLEVVAQEPANRLEREPDTAPAPARHATGLADNTGTAA